MPDLFCHPEHVFVLNQYSWNQNSLTPKFLMVKCQVWQVWLEDVLPGMPEDLWKASSQLSLTEGCNPALQSCFARIWWKLKLFCPQWNLNHSRKCLCQEMSKDSSWWPTLICFANLVQTRRFGKSLLPYFMLPFWVSKNLGTLGAAYFKHCFREIANVITVVTFPFSSVPHVTPCVKT